MTRRDALTLAGGALAGTAMFGWQGASHAEALAATAIPVADGLTVQPRSVWAGSDRNPVGSLGTEDVRFLLVHHTASANGADPIATMRGVYNFHTGPDRGWPDVAYNFFVDDAGVVYEARAGSLVGPVEASATGGSQGFAQLVCLLGDFTLQNPTDAALASLTSTLAWLGARYDVDTTPGATVAIESRGSNRWMEGEVVAADTVSGHREMSQTACPGDTFYPYLKSVIWPAVHDVAIGAVPTSAPAATTAPATSAPPTTAAPPTTGSDTRSSDVPDASGAPSTASPSVTSTGRATASEEISGSPSPAEDTQSSVGPGMDPGLDDTAGSDSRGDAGIETYTVVGGAAVATGAAALAWRARRRSQTW